MLVGTPQTSPMIAKLGWDAELKALGDEGFIIRGAAMARRNIIAIASNTQRGALYGAFAFLRLLRSRSSLAALNISDRPVNKLRQIQDWTNWGWLHRARLRRLVDTAGRSVAGEVNPRIELHARALAALGVNGVTLNDVDARRMDLPATCRR